ncbi:MAG TPA: epoxide hydrolase [Polyangiaceae bacterium]
MSAVPFVIHLDDDLIDDLRLRLEQARWTRIGQTSDFSAGTNPDFLRKLVTYWRFGYDFRRQEARLNTLPHFEAEVGGAKLHYVHVRGRGPAPTPLLLLHGWPDSFHRYHKVLPILADPARAGAEAGDAFDLVVPSLPGFGFSSPATPAPGVPLLRCCAELLWRLMTEVLGYERFAVAGGDTGGVLAQILAIDHPRSVSAIHLTDLGWHTQNVDPEGLSKEEAKYLDELRENLLADGAYALVQTTRPATLAASLNDSPVGLASWIVDRFHAWSDGDLEKHFGLDDLITNIMIYWVTQSIGSSMFAYYAERKTPSLTTADRVERPVGLALFPDGAGALPPRSFAERTLNVERYRILPRGGHFAPLEAPGLYARELIEFFRSHRGSQKARSLEDGNARSAL